MTLPLTNGNRLPENIDYVDDGCEVAPRCLECPLARCKHDERFYSKGNKEMPVAERNAKVFELRKKGIPTPDIARAFKIAPRTVLRIVQNGGAPPKRINTTYEEPKVKPENLEQNGFKPYMGAASISRRNPIYSKACPTCNGDVEVDERYKTAKCMQCSRDPRNPTWRIAPVELPDCEGAGRKVYYTGEGKYKHCPLCRIKVTAPADITPKHKIPHQTWSPATGAPCSGAGKDPLFGLPDRRIQNCPSENGMASKQTATSERHFCPDCYRRVELLNGVVPNHKRQGG